MHELWKLKGIEETEEEGGGGVGGERGGDGKGEGRW